MCLVPTIYLMTLTMKLRTVRWIRIAVNISCSWNDVKFYNRLRFIVFVVDTVDLRRRVYICNNVSSYIK